MVLVPIWFGSKRMVSEMPAAASVLACVTAQRSVPTVRESGSRALTTVRVGTRRSSRCWTSGRALGRRTALRRWEADLLPNDFRKVNTGFSWQRGLLTGSSLFSLRPLVRAPVGAGLETRPQQGLGPRRNATFSCTYSPRLFRRGQTLIPSDGR